MNNYVSATSDRCKLCKTQCSSTKIGDEVNILYLQFVLYLTDY